MKIKLLLVAAVGVAAVGIGMGTASGAGSRVAKACGPAPHKLAKRPTLPKKFPTPTRVVYSASKKAGPSTIISAYWTNGNLTAAHHAYSTAFRAAGYSVTHEEQDEADSEVAFAGSKTTGQVALAKRCDNRILITITIRPA